MQIVQSFLKSSKEEPIVSIEYYMFLYAQFYTDSCTRYTVLISPFRKSLLLSSHEAFFVLDWSSLSNRILPSGPMLAVLIRTGLESCPGEIAPVCLSNAEGEFISTVPGDVSASSLISRFAKTSLSLVARVCTNIVAGPWN